MSMYGFGELNFEASRACPDDEDEEAESYRLDVEWTEEGQKCVAGVSQPFVFCGFVGKVALGFGEGFLANKEKFTPLGQIFITGNEGTVDLCSLRRRRNATVRLFSAEEGTVVFAMIEFYGVPRFLAGQLVDKMAPLIKQASTVVMFHSEVAAYYRGRRNPESGAGKLFYLTAGDFPASNLGNVGVNGKKLRIPNVIGGPSAAILNKCQQFKKPALLLIIYTDAEFVDSINLDPFFRAIGPKPNDESTGFNLAELFSKFPHSIRQSADINNLYT